jgi:exosortase F-associated protein
MLKNKGNIIFGIILLGLLICIRAFEDNLFYDPFLKYFKGEYLNNPLPIYNPIKLFFSLGFRFYLNSMISLALLYVFFKDSKIIKFSTLLFIVLGSTLMISFFFTLKFFGEESKMTLFYIRRFIIQPIFLMVFLPAFYYQKKVK